MHLENKEDAGKETCGINMKMVVFDIVNDDLFLFDKLKEQYPDDVLISSSRGFFGELQLHEIMIVIAPSIIPSIALTIQNILSYKKEQYRTDANNRTEIKLKIIKQDNEYEFLFNTSSINDKTNISEIFNNSIKAISEIEGSHIE